MIFMPGSTALRPPAVLITVRFVGSPLTVKANFLPVVSMELLLLMK